ncbi:MAG: PAS domain S-box protein [Chloroflexi bacterium]|nr:PAS domain S-box protein [Chloroflexota bacterium]
MRSQTSSLTAHSVEKQLRAKLRELNKELRTLKQSQKLWTASFNYSPVALCIVSLQDGTVRDSNLLFSQLTGYAQDELRGTPVTRLFAAGAAHPFDPMPSQTSEPPLEMPAAFVARNGESRMAVWGVKVMEVSGEPCAVAAVMDLTNGRQREMALGREAAGLAMRISELESDKAQLLEHEQRFLGQIDSLKQETQQLKLDLIQARRSHEEFMAEARRLRENAGMLMNHRPSPKPATSALRRLTAVLRIDRRSVAEADNLVAAAGEPDAAARPEPTAAIAAADTTPPAVESPIDAPIPGVAVDQPAVQPAPPVMPEPVLAQATDTTTPVIRLSLSERQLTDHIAALRQMADRIDAEVAPRIQ